MDLNTVEARSGLAKIITNLFDRWELNAEERLNLLGLNGKDAEVLAGFRDGKPLPNREESLVRVGHLLSIHKTLGLLFPKNAEIKYSWVKLMNKELDNSTPLEIMLSDGILGMDKISRHLDSLTTR